MLGGCIRLLVLDVPVLVHRVNGMLMSCGAVMMRVVAADPVMVLAERAMQAHVQSRHELESAEPEQAGHDSQPTKGTLFERSSAHDGRHYRFAPLRAMLGRRCLRPGCGRGNVLSLVGLRRPRRLHEGGP